MVRVPRFSLKVISTQRTVRCCYEMYFCGNNKVWSIETNEQLISSISLVCKRGFNVLADPYIRLEVFQPWLACLEC